NPRPATDPEDGVRARLSCAGTQSDRLDLDGSYARITTDDAGAGASLARRSVIPIQGRRLSLQGPISVGARQSARLESSRLRAWTDHRRQCTDSRHAGDES